MLKEPSLYRKREKESMLLVAVYVDDLLIIGSKLKSICDFKWEISEIFELSDLGLLTYYLGIEARQSSESITLNQENYTKKNLSEGGMDDCNQVHAPMEFGLKLSKAPEEQSVDATEYMRMIGCLRYMIHTRPDLSFCVGLLS